MSPRTLIGKILAIAGSVAVAWAVRHLVLLEACGGEYGTPCPPGSEKYMMAMAFGMPAAIIGGLLARSLIGLLAIPATAVGALWAFTEAPPGKGTLPLLIGVIFAAVSAVPAWFFLRHRKQAQLAQWMFTHGRPAVATLTGVHDTGVTVNMNPRVRMTFRVEPDDGSAAFDTAVTAVVSRLDIPRPGQRYPVWYDPADRSRHLVMTRVSQTVPQSARERFAQITADNATVASETATAPAQREGGAEDHRLEKLAKLNELRLAGALTDEEFAAEKEKLLRGDG